MKILKLLSEEALNFSYNYIIVEKVKVIKESLNDEFTSIYYLYKFI